MEGAPRVERGAGAHAAREIAQKLSTRERSREGIKGEREAPANREREGDERRG
jgi:hypothetical protein